MEQLHMGIIALMKSAITGKAVPLGQDFDLDKAYGLIKSHQVIPLAYEGALRCGVAKNTQAMAKLCDGYCQNLLHSEEQMLAVQRVFSAFEENGIDYLPLKGCNVKLLYPKPELRVMADADILIRPEQYSRISPIMESLGFQMEIESDHEYVWDSPTLHLELHKRLIPSYNRDYYAYFGDGWRLAKQHTGCRYQMTREDDFIYQFTHFAKHYRDGGIGCRHVTDLWVWRRTYAMDEAYLCTELEKLQLLEFYDNICRVISVWFDDASPDAVTDFITAFIFQSGSWGRAEARVLSAEAKNQKASGSAVGGRLRSLWTVLFPNALTLQRCYPVLKKAPWLLPVFWPVNWVSKLLFRRDAIKRRRKEWAMATPERVDAYQQALNYVGLDFRFE